MNDVLNLQPGDIDVRRAVAMPMTGEAKARFRIADAMRRWCMQSLGSKLKAVILTGSLARDEATFSQSGGCLRFLSDAEFLVLLEDRASVPAPHTMTLICRGAEEELRNQGVMCKLSCGVVRESYLANVGDTIFGYELLSCGEVLYGDPGLLSRQRRPDLLISHEDGWRLLANRTVELLEIVPELSHDDGTLSEAAQYRLTKLYLDMATSLLVFKDEFVAGYQARAERLQSLNKRHELGNLPFETDRFVDVVRQCSAYKVMGCWNGASPFLSRDSVRLAIANLQALWSWELAQMTGGQPNDPPTGLLRRHSRAQLRKDRIRGWAYAAVRVGPAASWRNSLRWLRLLKSASPRYCVYAAAMTVWERLHGDPNMGPRNDCQDAREWLPVVQSIAASQSDLVGLVASILWNYQEFLVETRL